MISRRVTLLSLLLTACSGLKPMIGESGLSALSFEIVPPAHDLPVGRDSGLWMAIKNNGTRSIAFVEVLSESSHQLDSRPEEGIEWSDYCGGCDLIHALSPGNTFFAGVNVHPQRAGPQKLQVNMHIRAISVETLDFLDEHRRMTATAQIIGCATDTCAVNSTPQGAGALDSSPVSFQVDTMNGSEARGVWTTIRNESSGAIAFISTTFGDCGWFGSDGVEEAWMQTHKHLLLPGEAYQVPLYVGINYSAALSTKVSTDARPHAAVDIADVTLNLRRVSIDTLVLLDEYVFRNESVTPR